MPCEQQSTDQQDGRGGSEATVTDASVVRDYLDPAYFAGGTLALEGNVNYTVIARDPAEGEDIGGNLVTLTLLTD